MVTGRCQGWVGTSSCTSVCPSVRMEQLGSQWSDLYETWCLSKVHPYTGHAGPDGERRYSSTRSLISVQDGVGGQSHAPAALPPGKTRYPEYRREVGWASGPVWNGAENLAPDGIRSPDRPGCSESLYRLRPRYPSIFRKSVWKIQVSLKSDKE